MTTPSTAVPATVIFGALAILCALFLPHIVKKRSYRLALLTCEVALVLFFTILRRAPGERQINMTPFWSYAKFGDMLYRHEILQNIIAFIPLGALLRASFPKLSFLQVSLICLAFSAAIEAIQYLFALGMCETDDLINNSLGGMIGYLLYGIGEGKSKRY